MYPMTSRFLTVALSPGSFVAAAEGEVAATPDSLIAKEKAAVEPSPPLSLSPDGDGPAALR